MEQEKKENYLIVVSTVVAVLAYKIGDFTFSLKGDPFINIIWLNYIIEFILKLALFILLTFFLLLFVKGFARKIL